MPAFLLTGPEVRVLAEDSALASRVLGVPTSRGQEDVDDALAVLFTRGMLDITVDPPALVHEGAVLAEALGGAHDVVTVAAVTDEQRSGVVYVVCSPVACLLLSPLAVGCFEIDVALPEHAPATLVTSIALSLARSEGDTVVVVERHQADGGTNGLALRSEVTGRTSVATAAAEPSEVDDATLRRLLEELAADIPGPRQPG